MLFRFLWGVVWFFTNLPALCLLLFHQVSLPNGGAKLRRDSAKVRGLHKNPCSRPALCEPMFLNCSTDGHAVVYGNSIRAEHHDLRQHLFEGEYNRVLSSDK